MGFVDFSTQLLQSLPEFLFILQILVYFGFVSVFGWIVMLGYRTYSSYPVKLGLRYGFGFLSLVCGIGISRFFSIEGVFFKLAQFDVFFGGLISSLILMISVFFITRNVFNISGIKKAIEKLEKRLERAEKISRKNLWKEWSFVLGIVILLVFVGFSLANFQGFPDITERISKEIGISPQEFSEMLPSENSCMSPLVLFQVYGNDIMNGRIKPYKDSEFEKRLKEEGKEIKVMYKLGYKGKEYILVITKNEICSFSESKLCSCFKL